MTGSGGVDAPNYTQTPNMLFDDYLPDMSEAELKVTLIITRMTFGWQLPLGRTLSLTELMAFTGLSKQGVLDGIAAGEKRGTIAKAPGLRDGRKVMVYALVVNGSEVKPVDLSLVNGVDRKASRGLLSRPRAVHSVDRSAVNPVDRTKGARTALGADEGDPLKKGVKESSKEKRERAASEANATRVTRSLSRSEEPQSGRNSTSPVGEGANAPGQGGRVHQGENTLLGGQNEGTPPSLEDVPGGGRAAGFPETVTLLRDSFGPTMLADMRREKAPKGVDRELWLALPPERVEALIEAAQTEADEAEKPDTWRTRLRKRLDEAVKVTAPTAPKVAQGEGSPSVSVPSTSLEVGTPVTFKRERYTVSAILPGFIELEHAEGWSQRVSRKNETDLAAIKVVQEALPEQLQGEAPTTAVIEASSVRAGSDWISRESGAKVSVHELDGDFVVLDNGLDYPLERFLERFEPKAVR